MVLVSACGCKSHLGPELERPKALDPVCPNPVFAGFGGPVQQQIKILVLGCLEHPGVYYVPKGSTLNDLMLKLGKTGNHEGCTPRFIDVYQGGSGNSRTKLIIHRPGRVKLNNVALEDNMVLSFPEAIF